MKVAVVTCTRDRVDYTRHCFARLRELAGCDYDHLVLDQGSSDDTWRWLSAEWNADRLRSVHRLPENAGIWIGFNRLIAAARELDHYDVVVTFDNDCELLTENTLRDVAAAALEAGAALSPRILGLRNPMPTINSSHGIDWTPAIGNIFMAFPAWVVDHRRFMTPFGHVGPFNEQLPKWGGDEGPFAAWMYEHAAGVGYLQGYEANHYRTTDGQHADYPDYFKRRVAEGGPA